MVEATLRLVHVYKSSTADLFERIVTVRSDKAVLERHATKRQRNLRLWKTRGKSSGQRSN